MAYSRRNWKETTAITAAELNRMEEGIDRISSGTWTPRVTWGIQGGTAEEGGTWGEQTNTGYWYRVGDLVFIHAVIDAYTKKNTGNLTIKNIPFSPHNDYAPAALSHLFGVRVGDGYMITARVRQDKTIEFVRQAISDSASNYNTGLVQVSDVANVNDTTSRNLKVGISAVYKIA